MRLGQYDIPDWLDRRFGRTPGFPDDAPPIYAHCYNDTVTDGDFSFEVLPLDDGDEVFERARAGVAALPASVRTPEVDVVGTLAGKSCYHGSASLWGWWSGDSPPSTYHAYSGCRPLSTSQADTLKTIKNLPDSPVRWIRALGDSNSRNFIKDGIPAGLMLIPPGTYPPEQEVAGAQGTFPCIYGLNPTNGKDEQFLCLLFPEGRTTPLLFSHAWFTMADNDSEPLEAVFRRTLRETFRTANHTASLLNDYFAGRFGHYDEHIFPHTVDTLLAPWPELLNLSYADHTLVSFGSHNTEATTADWTAKLDNLTAMWPRSTHEPELVSPEQPRREDLSFVYTTPVNSNLIPSVRRALAPLFSLSSSLARTPSGSSLTPRPLPPPPAPPPSLRPLAEVRPPVHRAQQHAQRGAQRARGVVPRLGRLPRRAGALAGRRRGPSVPRRLLRLDARHAGGHARRRALLPAQLRRPHAAHPRPRRPACGRRALALVEGERARRLRRPRSDPTPLSLDVDVEAVPLL